MMSKLQKVRDRAEYLGIPGMLNISNKKGKKFMIELPDKTIIHFGQQGYEDFLDHYDEKRRQSYLARAKGIKNKSGKLTSNDPYSPNYYSIRLLW